jgi:hypothetical protein
MAFFECVANNGTTLKLVGSYTNSTYNNTLSIDLKSKLPSYNSYTKDDFLAVPTGFSVTTTVISGTWGVSPTISSYSNGILKINNVGGTVSGGGGSISFKATAFKIYLI